MFRMVRYSERHKETFNVVVEQTDERTSEQTGAMHNVTFQTEGRVILVVTARITTSVNKS